VSKSAVATMLGCVIAGCGGDSPMAGDSGDESAIEVLWAHERGADGREFEQILGAVTLPNGVIAVADHMTARVHFFSPTGSSLAWSGGTGSGPGEFRDLTAFGASRDGTAWAYDRNLRRVTWFGEDGRTMRSAPVETDVASWGSNMLGELDSGALVLVEKTVPFPNAQRTTPTYRDSTLVVAYLPGDSVASAIGRFPLFDMTVGRNSRGPTTSIHPHGPRLQATVDRKRRGVLIGFSDAPEIRLLSAAGVELNRIHVPLIPRKVTAAENAVVEERRARLHQDRSSLAEAPTHMPVFGRILSITEGDVWVEVIIEPGDPAQWVVLRHDRSPPVTVTLPKRFTLLEVNGTRILGVSRDEDDVETLVYAVLRR